MHEKMPLAFMLGLAAATSLAQPRFSGGNEPVTLSVAPQISASAMAGMAIGRGAPKWKLLCQT